MKSVYVPSWYRSKMVSTFLISLAFAEMTFSGTVTALKKDPITSEVLITFNTFSVPLKTYRGPLYACVSESLKKNKEVIYSFDAKSLKLQNCKSI